MNFFTFFKMDQEQKIVTYITLNLISLSVRILFETVLEKSYNLYVTKYIENKL